MLPYQRTRLPVNHTPKGRFLPVKVRRPEGVFRHSPSRRKDDKVCDGHPCSSSAQHYETMRTCDWPETTADWPETTADLIGLRPPLIGLRPPLTADGAGALFRGAQDLRL